MQENVTIQTKPRRSINKSCGQAPKWQALPQSSLSTCSTRLEKKKKLNNLRARDQQWSGCLLDLESMRWTHICQYPRWEGHPTPMKPAAAPSGKPGPWALCLPQSHTALAERPPWFLPFRLCVPLFPLKASLWCPSHVCGLSSPHCVNAVSSTLNTRLWWMSSFCISSPLPMDGKWSFHYKSCSNSVFCTLPRKNCARMRTPI